MFFFVWGLGVRRQRNEKMAHKQHEHKVSGMDQCKVPKFITINEMQRRQTRAEQQAKDEIAAKQNLELQMAAEQTAKAEAQRIAMQVAKSEAATEAAAMKKATLLSTLGKLRGSWAARAREELKEVDGVLEAVKKLQRARRAQVSSDSGEQYGARSGCRVACRAMSCRSEQWELSEVPAHRSAGEGGVRSSWRRSARRQLRQRLQL